MYSKVPALKDSNSIVALSVSISARISPSDTLSPTFFNHVATVPSVIVSLKRGIVTITTPLGKVVGCWLLVVGVAETTVSSTAAVSTFAGVELIKSEISSPSFPMIANRESQAADSPSLIPIYKSVPELKDSNSIVALSVSISARISPSETLSPTFLSHEATVPSVIVSLNRGMVITFAIIISVYEG